MAKLKNTSGNTVTLYAAPGELNAFRVEHEGEVIVPGAVTNERDSDDDAWVIGEGDGALRWPRSSWELVHAGTGSGDKPKPSGRKSSDDKTEG